VALVECGDKKLLAPAERTYAERRAALIEALAVYGITAHGSSGLGVWVPLDEEVTVVQLLLGRGWAVSPGGALPRSVDDCAAGEVQDGSGRGTRLI
jgi:DNA-binding transcriptional MocR family regulator